MRNVTVQLTSGYISSTRQIRSAEQAGEWLTLLLFKGRAHKRIVPNLALLCTDDLGPAAVVPSSREITDRTVLQPIQAMASTQSTQRGVSRAVSKVTLDVATFRLWRLKHRSVALESIATVAGSSYLTYSARAHDLTRGAPLPHCTTCCVQHLSCHRARFRNRAKLVGWWNCRGGVDFAANTFE